MNQYRHQIMRSPALTRISALAAPLALGLLLVVPLSGPGGVKWKTTTKIQVVHDHVKTSGPVTTVIRTVTVTKMASPPSRSVNSNGGSVAPPVLRSAVVANTQSGTFDGTFDVVKLPLSSPGAFTLSTSASVTAQLNCHSETTTVTTQVISDGTCTLILTDINGEGGTWQLTPNPVQ